MTFQRGWRVCLDPLLCCSARVWAPNSTWGEIVSYPQESQSLVGFGKRESPRSRRGRKNQLTNKLLFCKTPCHGFEKGKAHGFTSQMQEPKSSVLVCELGQSQEASISLTFHLRKSVDALPESVLASVPIWVPRWMSALPAHLSQTASWGSGITSEGVKSPGGRSAMYT